MVELRRLFAALVWLVACAPFEQDDERVRLPSPDDASLVDGDASPEGDGGGVDDGGNLVDASPSAGIACGAATCEIGADSCCLTALQPTCVPVCQSNWSVACTSTADCTGDQVCCLVGYRAACVAECPADGRRLCGGREDCGAGEACKPVSCSGQGWSEHSFSYCSQSTAQKLTGYNGVSCAF
jgi:hypothetical protein